MSQRCFEISYFTASRGRTMALTFFVHLFCRSLKHVRDVGQPELPHLILSGSENQKSFSV